MDNKYFDVLPVSMLLEGSFASKEVFIDKKRLNVEPSRKVWAKSTEFNWGYGGSGPAQLALAILLRYWDKEMAINWYQSFKWSFIARLPATDFIKTVNLREIMVGIVEKEEDKV